MSNSAMREALLQVALSCSACPRNNCKGCTRPFASFMPAVRKALSAPRLNCEVGTAEEQTKRFEEMCDSHNACKDCELDGMCKRYFGCAFAWGQMPYAESEAK